MFNIALERIFAENLPFWYFLHLNCIQTFSALLCWSENYVWKLHFYAAVFWNSLFRLNWFLFCLSNLVAGFNACLKAVCILCLSTLSFSINAALLASFCWHPIQSIGSSIFSKLIIVLRKVCCATVRLFLKEPF